MTAPAVLTTFVDPKASALEVALDALERRARVLAALDPEVAAELRRLAAVLKTPAAGELAALLEVQRAWQLAPSNGDFTRWIAERIARARGDGLTTKPEDDSARARGERR